MPILARTSSWSTPPNALVLILLFHEDTAVIVEEGGQLTTVTIEELEVERPTMEFPIGYAFSRVDAEKVPA